MLENVGDAPVFGKPGEFFGTDPDSPAFLIGSQGDLERSP
jgi:hypothetical protein